MPTDGAESETLPVAALLALAMTGFLSIVTETLPAGLLPQVAAGMAISPSLAGQLVTVYAAGSLLAALPLVTLTQGMPRRPLLMIAVGGFLCFNLLTAWSHDVTLTMVARFLAGVSAGLSWGMLGGFARRMVVDRLKGKALAIAMVGTPVALSIGVPLGTFLGQLLGWRTTFAAMSVLALALLGFIRWAVPDLPGQPGERRVGIVQVLRMPGVAPVLATAFAWVTAHYVLYTYVAPFATSIGMAGRVDAVLLGFGCASLGGIWLAGVLVDTRLRIHVLASIAAFGACAAVFWALSDVRTPVFAAIAVWGVTFGGAATALQTAASDAAGEGVDIVGAMLTTVWNAAIASGGAIGALLYARGGVAAFPPVMLALIALAFVIATTARTHGFVAGPRST